MGWYLTRIALLLALLSGQAEADSGRINERLALYALETGEAAEALHWIADASSPKAASIRGRAYAQLGLVRQARDALSAANDEHPLEPEARLTLAKANRALGKDGDADQLLRAIQRQGQGKVAEEAAFLLAEQAIGQSSYDRAGQILANSPEGYWSALGYLNLATAYGRQDEDVTRSLISLRVAQAMLGDRATTSYPDLLQRIQLTAAFLALKGEDADKALTFLNKISLNGYHTPQALYLHGLAHARKDNYRAAMQSWHRARKFPLSFPGAADAWLGMGRGFDESGYLGQSGEAYLGAIAAFEGELATLDTLKRQIRAQGGYEAMALSAKAEDVEWFLADSKTLTQPRLAYLMHFMESAEAQQAVARVADLERMEERLRKRLNDLDVLGGMLSERRTTLRRHLDTGDLDALKSRMTGLRERQQRLQSEIQTMAESGRSVELARGELARKLEQVRVLEAKNNLTPEEAERLKRLRGVLEWEAQEQFELARREHERELAHIGAALDAAEKSYGRFEQQLRGASERFAQRSKRVDQLETQTRITLERVVGLRQSAGELLNSALLGFLDRQSVVMSAHLDRSEQQLAHLYEYLALNRKADSAAGAEQ
ncbi:coiled-coil domain-containing protein [Marinobacter fonticola]|uniref:hypothetical protein n=1 Tax=Marinobacter fonticola TaxID=2603215 RepID=UPI0011E63291|nr:hypothetical protein [Marinobacter fonticola]